MGAHHIALRNLFYYVVALSRIKGMTALYFCMYVSVGMAGIAELGLSTRPSMLANPGIWSPPRQKLDIPPE